MSSDRVWGVLLVNPLPHDRPADAEEAPQVAEESAVERVLLRPEVLQVGDPVAGHELPGGAVDGDQVEVAAQQERHDCGEDPHDAQRRQEKAVRLEPRLPRNAWRNPRPETERSFSSVFVKLTELQPSSISCGGHLE